MNVLIKFKIYNVNNLSTIFDENSIAGTTLMWAVIQSLTTHDTRKKKSCKNFEPFFEGLSEIVL